MRARGGLYSLFQRVKLMQILKLPGILFEYTDFKFTDVE